MPALTMVGYSARFTAGRVKSLTLSRIFAIALVVLAVQRAWILMT